MKSFFLGTALLIGVLINIHHAHAIGVGLTINGNFDRRPDNPLFEPRSEFNRSYIHSVDADLVFDTTIGINNIFNYRLGLSYRDLIIEEEDYYVSFHGMNECILTNTFGIGIVRNSFMRLWAGPQVGMTYVNHDWKGKNPLTGDLGVVMGVNWNTDESYVISMDLGLRARMNSDETLLEPFINLNLLYRIGETYIP